jgi:hypothetical protein
MVEDVVDVEGLKVGQTTQVNYAKKIKKRKIPLQNSFTTLAQPNKPQTMEP